jgi:hypothetical protein
VFAFPWHCGSRAAAHETRHVRIVLACVVLPTSQPYRQVVYEMLSLTLPILLFASPISVVACEGECIKGITLAWLGNYTTPIDTVFKHVVRRPTPHPHISADVSQAMQISQDLFPPESHHDSMSYLQPIRSAYEESSYEGMRTAIFPSYFHGKCQRNGVDPPGCPNPDCPVVCGTPGSLVHFFPKLRFIVFNYVRNTLQQLCSPGNEAYEKSEHAVVQAAARHRRREGRQVPWFEYAVIGAGGELARSLELDKNHSYVRRREENVKKEFERIVRQVPILLEEACGGRASEDENALPKCSWEDRMKSYTLTFP